MQQPGGGGRRPAVVVFGARPWAEEVERYRPSSQARRSAERARQTIELGHEKLDWLRCRPEGPDSTQLPGCRKLYVPLGKRAPSEAPYGFVFQLVQRPDASLAWTFVAFGERHPSDPDTRTVYERAHKRLHGRYPD